MTDETLKHVVNTAGNLALGIGFLVIVLVMVLSLIGWGMRKIRRAWVGPEQDQDFSDRPAYETTVDLECGCETDQTGFLTYRRAGCRIKHPLKPAAPVFPPNREVKEGEYRS